MPDALPVIADMLIEVATQFAILCGIGCVVGLTLKYLKW